MLTTLILVAAAFWALCTLGMVALYILEQPRDPAIPQLETARHDTHARVDA